MILSEQLTNILSLKASSHTHRVFVDILHTQHDRWSSRIIDSFGAKPIRLNCAFCATSTIFKGNAHFNMTMNIICVMLSLNFQLTFSSQTVSILNASCLC